MKKFRKIIFWLHLASGVVAGVVIFIMSVTGALLAFEKNIIEFAEREMRVAAVPSENAQRLPVGEIIAKVREAKPDATPSNITLQNEADAAALVALGSGRQVFVNPYTGEITGEGAKGVREFFRTTTDWHRWLALSGDGRAVGKAITGACNLAFLFLAISGFYIWFPRRGSWRHFRAAMVFRWKVKGKARDFNWHTVIGFWSSLVLIVLTITAAVISYTWASNLLYTLTGSEPPRQQQRAPNAESAEKKSFVIAENISALWQRAEQQAPEWKSISLRLPVQEDSPAVFTIDEGKSWNIFGRSQLTLDAKTAEAVKWESYSEQNAGRQLRSWFRFTHTGESFGIVGQLIGFLACVGGAFLVWTGFSLAWRRFRNWLSKRSSGNLPVG